MTDPYREEPLQARIEKIYSELKADIIKLDKKIDNSKLIPSVWTTFKSTFHNFTHWDRWSSWGISSLTIMVISIGAFGFFVPFWMQSCEAEAEREITRQQQSCDALGLSYVTFHDDIHDHTDYIFCADDDHVVYLNTAYPESSYTTTVGNFRGALPTNE